MKKPHRLSFISIRCHSFELCTKKNVFDSFKSQKREKFFAARRQFSAYPRSDVQSHLNISDLELNSTRVVHIVYVWSTIMIYVVCIRPKCKPNITYCLLVDNQPCLPVIISRQWPATFSCSRNNLKWPSLRSFGPYPTNRNISFMYAFSQLLIKSCYPISVSNFWEYNCKRGPPYFKEQSEW